MTADEEYHLPISTKGNKEDGTHCSLRSLIFKIEIEHSCKFVFIRG
jgi:hypothetical protein